MGMDVHGLNPKIKEGSVKPEEIDWGKATKEEKDKFIEAKNKYQEENVGVSTIVFVILPAGFIVSENEVVKDCGLS